MPTDPITDAVQKIPGEALRGFFFRSISLKYVKTPLSAIGSKLRGGRYNPAGVVEAFYLTDRIDATLYETGAIQKGVLRRRVAPIVTFTVDGALQRVLDLTKQDVLDAIGIAKHDLLVDWLDEVARGVVPRTHLLGIAAYRAGFEAIRAPSARLDGATNLVVFIDNLLPGSSITISPDAGFSTGATISIKP